MLLGEQIGTPTLQSQRSAGRKVNINTLITNKGSGVRYWVKTWQIKVMVEEEQPADLLPTIPKLKRKSKKPVNLQMAPYLSSVLCVLGCLSASPWLHPDSKSTLLIQSRGDVTMLSNTLQHTCDPTVALLDMPVTEMNAHVHQEEVDDHSIFSCGKRKHKCYQALSCSLCSVIMYNTESKKISCVVLCLCFTTIKKQNKNFNIKAK